MHLPGTDRHKFIPKTYAKSEDGIRTARAGAEDPAGWSSGRAKRQGGCWRTTGSKAALPAESSEQGSRSLQVQGRRPRPERLFPLCKSDVGLRPVELAGGPSYPVSMLPLKLQRVVMLEGVERRQETQ